MSDYRDSECEMSCGELRANVDKLLSGMMHRDDQVRLFNHAACCKACGMYLDWAREVQRLVVEAAPVEPASDNFQDRVFRAAGADEGRGGRRVWPAGAAVAAVVLMALVVWPLLSEQTSPEPQQASLPLEVWEPEVRQVRLAFSSREALDDVRLTLELPDNVELESFPGRQMLSWRIDLSPGENLLTLPLRVLYPAEAELVARLDVDDGGRGKTFRASIPGVSLKPGKQESETR